MQCPRCGEENPAKAGCCLECATPLTLKCPECAAELPPRAKFCVECAHPVAQPTAPARQLPAREAYTPQHLAERIISSRSALEGERKRLFIPGLLVHASAGLATRYNRGMIETLRPLGGTARS